MSYRIFDFLDIGKGIGEIFLLILLLLTGIGTLLPMSLGITSNVIEPSKSIDKNIIIKETIALESSPFAENIYFLSEKKENCKV